MSLLKRLFAQNTADVAPISDHYFVALVNEARNESERIDAVRAARGAFGLRRAA